MSGRQLTLGSFSTHRKHTENHRGGSSKETGQLEFPAEVERFPLLPLARTSLFCVAFLLSKIVAAPLPGCAHHIALLHKSTGSIPGVGAHPVSAAAAVTEEALQCHKVGAQGVTGAMTCLTWGSHCCGST